MRNATVAWDGSVPTTEKRILGITANGRWHPLLKEGLDALGMVRLTFGPPLDITDIGRTTASYDYLTACYCP